MVNGKYFVIVSKQSGMALDIKGGSASPGTAVILWDKHGRDNQQWFYDPVSNAIRSKANPDLCLTIDGSNRLSVDHYRSDGASQHWQVNKHREVIENRADVNRVLDVVGASGNKGAEVCAWNYHGRDNQRWTLEFQPIRYFYIKSELNGFVLDIERASSSPGTKVITYKPKGSDNQLWFEDVFGNIRSKLNEKLVLDASDGTLRVGHYTEGGKRIYWSVQGNRVVNVNNHNEVLDIKGNNKDKGAEVCAWNYKGSSNQHWTIEYV